MDADGGVDERIALPFLYQPFAQGQFFIDAPETGGREVDERFARYAPDAGFLGFFGDDVFKEIHIVEAGSFPKSFHTLVWEVS